PVSFTVLGPWSVPEREIDTAQEGGLADLVFLLYVGGAWIAGIVLARRNLRLGRGDRSGALRVAAFVLVTGVAGWVFAAHHVPRPTREFDQFLSAIMESLYFAAFVWLAYVAMELSVRKRAPELWFSWSRVLTGRFRDPLVGRDVLAGILGSAALALMVQA